MAAQAAPVAGSAAPATPTSGLLVVDKPRGVTSHDIVAAARGALHMKKVGHAGTLDPMATGVLVVGFGNATRLLNHIVEHDKTYEATIRLGQSTTTDDADGELLSATSPERWQELLALPVAGGPQSAGENGPANAAKVRSWQPQRSRMTAPRIIRIRKRFCRIASSCGATVSMTSSHCSSPAASSRCQTRSPQSKSTVNVPMIWPATARTCSSRRVGSPSARSVCWMCGSAMPRRGS